MTRTLNLPHCAAMFVFHKVIILFALVVGISLGRINIQSMSPESGTIIPADSDATLTCTTSLPWYICIWEGPGGISCQCQAGGGGSGGVSSLCQGYPKVSLTGSGNVCSATIAGLSQEDAGQWRCVLGNVIFIF